METQQGRGTRRELTWQAIARVRQLATQFRKRRAQLAGEAGLTEAQWRILEQIATEHFMPSLFAREQDHTPGAVSKLIRQVLDKNLIRVSISPHDGRQRRYELTAKGKRKMTKLRQLREDAIQRIWSDLPMADLQAFVRLSDNLIARMRDYATESE